MPCQPEPHAGRDRAFTLVELLLVIVIIAVLVAILVPALGGAREAARRAQSRTLITQLGQAVGVFGNDHDGNAPGLFSARDMGHSDNADEGFSAMENMILALAGSDAVLGLNDANYSGETDMSVVALVGPQTDPMTKYWVNPSLIGTSDAYFDVSPEYFVAQTRQTQQMAASVGPAATEEERAMGNVEIPDLVDAWGQPILVWTKDQYGSRQVRQSAMDIDAERAKFAQIDSTADDDMYSDPAWFYWNSNAAFLRAEALGEKRFDMTTGPDDANNAAFSLIGEAMTDSGNQELLLHTMAALLGSTAGVTLQDESGTYYDPEDLLPGAARSNVVIHSAGRDGVYLSSKDPGMGNASEDGEHIDFGASFYPPGTMTGGQGERYEDDAGQATSVDVIQDFDDLVVGAGS